MEKINWVILGAGEFGREIYNIFFKNSKRKLKFFVDDDKTKKILLRKKVIRFENLLKLNNKFNFVLAILNQNTRRKKIIEISKYKNLIPENLIHEDVYFYNSKIGIGNILYPNSNINYSSKLGNYNVLQFNSSIGHNTKIADNCFIGSNSTISSNCNLQKNIFIGANSNIAKSIKISSEVHISPSSYVYKNIKKNTKVTSLPRLILQKFKI